MFQDDPDKDEGDQRLDEEGGADLDLGGLLSVRPDREAHQSGERAADELGDDVRHEVANADAAAQQHAEGDGGIEVATRDARMHRRAPSA